MNDATNDWADEDAVQELSRELVVESPHAMFPTQRSRRAFAFTENEVAETQQQWEDAFPGELALTSAAL